MHDTAVTAEDITDSVILPNAFPRMQDLCVEENIFTAVLLLLEREPKSRWTEEEILKSI